MVEWWFPIAYRADRGMNGPVPWGSGKKGRKGWPVQPANQRFRRLPHLTVFPSLPLCLSLHTPQHRPAPLSSSLLVLTKAPAEWENLILSTLTIGMNAEPHVPGCWSAATLHVEPREKKNRESNNLNFSHVPAIYFFFFFSVILGPHKRAVRRAAGKSE